MFLLLSEYKAEYGTAKVANRRKYKGKSLGEWCARQRREYTKEILKGPRQKALIDIGFEFNPIESDWDCRYKQYKRYIADNNGNPYITCSTIYEGMSLGDWVTNQHEKYIAGKLSTEKLEKMRAVDPDRYAAGNPIHYHKKEWLRKYELYKSYIKETGSTKILHRTIYKEELLGR